ncbi:MAG: ATP-dependent protease ATPase subunit HslU [Negativicutes bacterium]|jgi:ATP-dependent HslUV protease ATP-binding subunit HslU
MTNLTPKQIVFELDKYIVGQNAAKKSVAIALRNRWRASQLPKDVQEDIIPKNILMIGPTGVGKTEIARRMAKIVDAPFVKVEATKFTEVGYVGRDVESMVRDLVETAVRLVKNRKMKDVEQRAADLAEERIIDCFVPKKQNDAPMNPLGMLFGNGQQPQPEANASSVEREKVRAELKSGLLEEKIIEIAIEQSGMPMLGMLGGGNMEEMGMNLQEMLGNMLPKKNKKRKVKVAEARKIFQQEEAHKLIDNDEVNRDGVELAETAGIIFVDEIDKIAGRGNSGGADVSREGVQRDILPIVEGSTVMTKYGQVCTDRVLFIAAGAFHMSKPSDLIPELQGRFPIRVELENLSCADFKRILTEPSNSIVKQYTKLLQTENVQVLFNDEALDEIADIAEKVNTDTENIGARRLHTILERLMEDISFHAPEAPGEIVITRDYVREKLDNIVKSQDLSQFIL